MAKLDATIAYLEDRISYFKNVNEFIRVQRERGIEVKTEGDFGNKAEIWFLGHQYCTELYRRDSVGRSERVRYIKTVIKDDITTMFNLLNFNVIENEKLALDETSKNKLQDTKKQMEFLGYCLNEINNLT